MYRCIGLFYVAAKRGQMYRYSDGPFHLKHSGGQMYRFSDGLSFILNIQEANVSI